MKTEPTIKQLEEYTLYLNKLTFYKGMMALLQDEKFVNDPSNINDYECAWNETLGEYVCTHENHQYLKPLIASGIKSINLNDLEYESNDEGGSYARFDVVSVVFNGIPETDDFDHTIEFTTEEIYDSVSNLANDLGAYGQYYLELTEEPTKPFNLFIED